MAVDLGNTLLIEELLKQGCNPKVKVNSTAAGGGTLVSVLLNTKTEEVMKLLLTYGATVDPTEDYTFRFLFTLRNKISCIKIICAELMKALGADADSELLNNILLFHLLKGESENDVEQAKEMVSLNKDLYTPLHELAKTGYYYEETILTKIIKNFIALGLDLDKQDSNGNTALHLAAQSANLFIVNELLNANADKNKPNNARQTPLDLCQHEISEKNIFLEQETFEEIIALLSNEPQANPM